jgi:hypothetical protein
MVLICESVLRKKNDDDFVDGPALVKLGVYDIHEEETFELRETDEHGRTRFRVRDSRKLIVLDEYETTLEELTNNYEPIFVPAEKEG